MASFWLLLMIKTFRHGCGKNFWRFGKDYITLSTRFGVVACKGAMKREPGETPGQTRCCDSCHNLSDNDVPLPGEKPCGKASDKRDKSEDLPGQHIVL